MTIRGLIVGLILSSCLVACSPTSHPETKLLGKWQEDFAEPKDSHEFVLPLTGIQLEFLSDGSVVLNERRGQGSWGQARVGSYSFVDASHIRLDFGNASIMDEMHRIYMDEVPRIYEVGLTDQTGLTLTTADGTFRLLRVR